MNTSPSDILQTIAIVRGNWIDIRIQEDICRLSDADLVAFEQMTSPTGKPKIDYPGQQFRVAHACQVASAEMAKRFAALITSQTKP
jgi:hypothetical protein